MALNPSTNTTMSGRITAADANYPYASAKDETSAGAGDGTPYFKARADDIFGFQQWLLNQASIVPSGNADNVLVSDYGDALNFLLDKHSPVGSVAMHSVPAVPADWLECDGAAVSRTTWADLFAVIGTNYGVGDGSTTFNLPDFRGQFARGWDNGAGTDPDAAGRTDRGDGTTGDNVGTKQADDFEAHTHTALRSGNTSGSAGLSKLAQSPVANDDTIGSTGGNETRPTNIYLMFIIKG